DRAGAGRDLVAAVRGATVGGARADTAPVRRADPTVDGRHGRLPPDPATRRGGRRRGAPVTLERPPSAIPGVRYGGIARFDDPRGSFRELWRASATGDLDP